MQDWIFAIKYLYSGTECSIKPNYLSLRCIKRTGWIGGLIYSGFIIISWCILIATWPGWLDLSKKSEWSKFIFLPIYALTDFLYLIINIASTWMTILGIRKILHTLQLLKHNNTQVETNKFTLTLHSTVLMLNALVLIFACLPPTWLSTH